MDDRKQMANMLMNGIIIGASFVCAVGMIADTEHAGARIWGIAANIGLQLLGWFRAIRGLRKSAR